MLSRVPKSGFVLLLEDYTETREMYAEYLAFLGYRVAQAADGTEAIEKACALAPDLVVLDLALPLLDGWEVTRRLRADSRTKHIPVIALSGHAFTVHQERAAASGCDAFLAKPCLPDVLAKTIRALLDARPVRASDGAKSGAVDATRVFGRVNPEADSDSDVRGKGSDRERTATR